MIIKRITQGQDGVAEWFYDFFEAGLESIDIFDPTTKNTKAHRLNLLNIILNTLREFELFEVQEAQVEWIKKPWITTTENFLEETITIKENEFNGHNIQEILTPRINTEEKVELTSAYMLGKSQVMTETEKKECKGVFTIHFNFSNIQITTDADIWLPYNLLAEPQPEIHQLNAPRLKNALENIEQLTGIEPVYDNTKYARVNKYELENRMDDEGKLEEVIERQYLQDLN